MNSFLIPIGLLVGQLVEFVATSLRKAAVNAVGRMVCLLMRVAGLLALDYES